MATDGSPRGNLVHQRPPLRIWLLSIISGVTVASLLEFLLSPYLKGLEEQQPLITKTLAKVVEEVVKDLAFPYIVFLVVSLNSLLLWRNVVRFFERIRQAGLFYLLSVVYLVSPSLIAVGITWVFGGRQATLFFVGLVVGVVWLVLSIVGLIVVGVINPFSLRCPRCGGNSITYGRYSTIGGDLEENVCDNCGWNSLWDDDDDDGWPDINVGLP